MKGLFADFLRIALRLRWLAKALAAAASIAIAVFSVVVDQNLEWVFGRDMWIFALAGVATLGLGMEHVADWYEARLHRSAQQRTLATVLASTPGGS